MNNYSFIAFLSDDSIHRTVFTGATLNEAYQKWFAEYGDVEFKGNLAIFTVSI